MVQIEQYHLKEVKETLPLITIATASNKAAERQFFLTKNKLEWANGTLHTFAESTGNTDFISSLVREIQQRRIGLESENFAFPNEITVDNGKTNYRKRSLTTDTPFKAVYRSPDANDQFMSPSVEFAFHERGLTTTARFKGMIHNYPAYNSFIFDTREEEKRLDFHLSYETRNMYVPVQLEEVATFAKSEADLAAAAQAGYVVLGCHGERTSQQDKEPQTWGVQMTGDSGDVITGFVDMSSPEGKIMIVDSRLTKQGIQKLLLQSLPRVLPMEGRAFTLYQSVGEFELEPTDKVYFQQLPFAS